MSFVKPRKDIKKNKMDNIKILLKKDSRKLVKISG